MGGYAASDCRSDVSAKLRIPPVEVIRNVVVEGTGTDLEQEVG